MQLSIPAILLKGLGSWAFYRGSILFYELQMTRSTRSQSGPFPRDASQFLSAMKIGSFLPSSYTALALKVAGVILILGTLVDFLVLTIPPNFLDNEWTVGLIGEWVSRGAIPLIGLALLALSRWFEGDDADSSRAIPQLALVISAILGLIFFLMAPLYFNSSRLVSAAQTRQINQQAAQAEQQLNALLEQQRDRVNSILSDQERLAQLEQQLKSLDLPADQQAQLKQVQETLAKVKNNPKLLDQEVAKARTQGMSQITETQQKALNDLQSSLRRDRLHMTVSSLLFSIGYLAIAWTGFSRNRKASPVKSRKRKR